MSDFFFFSLIKKRGWVLEKKKSPTIFIIFNFILRNVPEIVPPLCSACVNISHVNVINNGNKKALEWKQTFNSLQLV